MGIVVISVNCAVFRGWTRAAGRLQGVLGGHGSAADTALIRPTPWYSLAAIGCAAALTGSAMWGAAEVRGGAGTVGDLEMISLPRDSHDDPAFLEIVSRITNSALQQTKANRLYLVRLDNWFDHKWLGYSGGNEHRKGALGGPDLRIPAFVPNRVVAETLWVRKDESYEPTLIPTPLHRKRFGDYADSLRVSQVSQGAVFVWYSANSGPNGRGSVMAYFPVEHHYWAWYAAFISKPWRPSKLVQIDASAIDELLSREHATQSP
jgi:hypothetical protein